MNTIPYVTLFALCMVSCHDNGNSSGSKTEPTAQLIYDAQISIIVSAESDPVSPHQIVVRVTNVGNMVITNPMLGTTITGTKAGLVVTNPNMLCISMLPTMVSPGESVDGVVIYGDFDFDVIHFSIGVTSDQALLEINTGNNIVSGNSPKYVSAGG